MSEDLKKELREASAQYDQIKNDYNAESGRVIDKFEAILQAYLPAELVIRNSSIDFWYSEKGAYKCSVQPSTNKSDDAFEFLFKKGEGVFLNNACIGSYSKKAAGYVAVIKGMAVIWNNIEKLEEALEQLDFTRLVELDNLKYAASCTKSKIESLIEKEAKEKFEAEVLQVGTMIILQRGYKDDLFNSKVFLSKYDEEDHKYLTAEITKITPKRVELEVTACYGIPEYLDGNEDKYTFTCKISKDVLLRRLCYGQQGAWKAYHRDDEIGADWKPIEYKKEN